MRLYNRFAVGRAVAYTADQMTEAEVQMLTSEEAEALAGNCEWSGKKEEQVPIPRRICGDRQVFVEKRTQRSPICEGRGADYDPVVPRRGLLVGGQQPVRVLGRVPLLRHPRRGGPCRRLLLCPLRRHLRGRGHLTPQASVCAWDLPFGVEVPQTTTSRRGPELAHTGNKGQSVGASLCGLPRLSTGLSAGCIRSHS